MSPEIIDYQQRIQELEKVNRVLQKRWERSYKEQIRLEANHRKTQFLLRKVIQEVEERQQKIAEQAQFLKYLWENVDYGIAVVEVVNRGEEFKFINVNPALSQIFSHTANLCGKTFAEVFPDNLIEINRGRFRKCLQIEQNITFEECLEVNHRNYWWQIYLSPIIDEPKDIQKIIVTFTNISERKKTEQKLATLLSNLPGAAYSCQKESNWQTNFVSEGIIDLTGYYPQEFFDNQVTFNQLTHPDDQNWVRQAVKDAIANCTQFNITYRLFTRNGEIKWVWERGQGIFSPDGELLAVDGFIADVTERKLVEEQLREKSLLLEDTLQQLQQTQAQIIQAEKMSSLGQLVAGIAHEINNPVNFIHGNLQHTNAYICEFLDLINLYQQEYPVPSLPIREKIAEIEFDFLQADLPKLLTSMQVGTERIREIVKSLRIFSRLDEAEVKTVDLHEGIESTLMILHNRLKSKQNRVGIEIIKNYDHIPPIECYAGQLNQVFMNILANAIDALEEAITQQTLSATPQITISTFYCIATQTVEIAIADNGTGIPPEIQSRIFDPFFTTKPVGKGTGMGMSISYQIITDKHQGDLKCISTPETGTKFIITIPIAAISRTGV